MNFNKLFENHEPRPMHLKKEGAVLFLLMPGEEGYEVVFEKRSNMVNQAGDASFIGGHVDPGETPEEAVYREALEEAHLQPEDFHLYGEMDYLLTLSGLWIHVFLGELKKPGLDQLIANDEVEEFFSIPLEFLLNTTPENYADEFHMKRAEDFPYESIPNGRNYPFWVGKNQTYFYYYKDHVVWGMTASMVRHFVKRVKKELM